METNSKTEAIQKEYHKRLLGFIQNRVNNFDDAEDILQDVFLRIHTHIDTLQQENKLQSWIYRITRNAIIDYYRSRKPMDELPDQDRISEPEKEPTLKIREEVSHCFSPLIQNLPDSYRRAVNLSELEGLPQKEIAKREGISLSGAKSRVQRGRVLLKEQLLACCDFERDHQGSVINYTSKRQNCDCDD